MKTHKLCRTCSTEKLLNDFARKSAAKDGRQPRCRSCQAAYVKGWRKGKEDRLSEQNKKWNADNKEARRAIAKRSYDKTWPAWYAKNKDRLNEELRQKYAADPERFLAPSRLWYQDNRAKANERSREWYAENADRRNEVAGAWRRDNPEKTRAYWSKHKAAKLLCATEDVDYTALYERDKACYLCGPGFLPEDTKHVDHKIALSRSELNPTHSYANCAVTHAPCNLRKNDKTPEEYWMAYGISWPLSCREFWV